MCHIEWQTAAMRDLQQGPGLELVDPQQRLQVQIHRPSQLGLRLLSQEFTQMKLTWER